MTYARRALLSNADAARDPRCFANASRTQYSSAHPSRENDNNDASDPPCERQVITTSLPL